MTAAAPTNKFYLNQGLSSTACPCSHSDSTRDDSHPATAAASTTATTATTTTSHRCCSTIDTRARRSTIHIASSKPPRHQRPRRRPLRLVECKPPRCRPALGAASISTARRSLRRRTSHETGQDSRSFAPQRHRRRWSRRRRITSTKRGQRRRRTTATELGQQRRKRAREPAARRNGRREREWQLG